MSCHVAVSLVTVVSIKWSSVASLEFLAGEVLIHINGSLDPISIQVIHLNNEPYQNTFRNSLIASNFERRMGTLKT
jgi:hypothetical protein